MDLEGNKIPIDHSKDRMAIESFRRKFHEKEFDALSIFVCKFFCFQSGFAQRYEEFW